MFSIPENNKFCRLCLTEEHKLVPIFTENEDIHQYINNFFAVEIKKDDPFSTNLCKLCLNFIIEIIRKRLKYRENDRRLKDSPKNTATEEQLAENSNAKKTNAVLRQPDTVKKETNDSMQQQITKQNNNIYMHPSVLDIFRTDENITMPIHFWPCNFDALVIMDGKPKPWPRYKDESTKIRKRKHFINPITNSEGSIESNSSKVKRIKVKKFSDDPTYYRAINSNKTNGKDLQQATNSTNGVDIPKDVKQKRRKTHDIERFGSPVFYEQTEFDALDIIMSEDPQCESYYIYNVNHDRPDIETLKYNGFPIVNYRDKKNNPIKSKHGSAPDVNCKKIIKSPLNDLVKPKAKRKTRKSKTTNENFQGNKRKVNKGVNCAEDKWNSFFNNYYAKPEQDSDSNDEENSFAPLLPVNVKRVYPCLFCGKVFYNPISHKKHLSTHEYKSVLDAQNRT